jgi:DNA-binding LacI/PurR family transcriptional regulator
VDVSSICFTAVTAGIEQNMEETKSKYSLVMFGANFQETPEKSLELIERRMVDGLILIILAPDIQKFNHQLMPQLKKLNIPFVVVHSTSQELPYNNVGLDSRQAGYDAAEHLIKAGHQRISFYMRDWHNPQLTEILGGFKKAVVDRGRAWSDKQIIEPVVDPGSDMYLAARKTIAQLLPLPRALFFPDDASAYAALAACEERGVRVPQDLAIMGCDDETIPYLTTRLTTIHHPFKEKGHEAVTMLTQILDGVLDPEAIHRKILRPYVVVRETCGGRNS